MPVTFEIWPWALARKVSFDSLNHKTAHPGKDSINNRSGLLFAKVLFARSEVKLWMVEKRSWNVWMMLNIPNHILQFEQLSKFSPFFYCTFFKVSARWGYFSSLAFNQRRKTPASVQQSSKQLLLTPWLSVWFCSSRVHFAKVLKKFSNYNIDVTFAQKFAQILMRAANTGDRN